MPDQPNDVGHEFTGAGAGLVPRWGIALVIAVLLALTTATLYSLWAFWPTGLSASGPAAATAAAPTVGQNSHAALPERKRVHYLGVTTLDVSTETLFFVVVALAGALGGLIHTLRSLSIYVGTRRLRWSWIPFNLMLPVVGALGGTVFYLVFRAGLFSPSTSVEQASPFGFAAIAALVGLFSEQAMEKLKQVAEELFAKPPQISGQDHYEPRKSDDSDARPGR